MLPSLGADRGFPNITSSRRTRMILLDVFLTRTSQSGSQLPTFFIFEQEVSLRGQSHETPDEGFQDELDVWVLVLHYHFCVTVWSEVVAKTAVFSEAFPHGFNALLFWDVPSYLFS